MLYTSFGLLFVVLRGIVGVENDTKVVGSYIHELKIKPSTDLLTAASKKYYGGHKLGDYNTFDTYHHKDGDSFGYGNHFEFDNTKGNKKKGDFDESSFDDDEAADSTQPKLTEWNFDDSHLPSQSYRFESDGPGSKGKLVGPSYVSDYTKTSTRPKRKKEQDAAASEYEDTYGDIEADPDAPAEYEAEEADPEYADAAEAYDYY